MKKYILSVSVLLLICLWTGSCDRTELVSDGEGTLRMNVTVEDAIQVHVTRGLNEEEQTQLQEACEIRLYSSSGLIRYYKGVEELPEELLLRSGEYTAVVTAGDSVDVSYDQVYYKGVEPFSILASKTTSVEVVSTIFNTVVAMDFDPTLEEGFSAYQVTVSSVKGELVFSREGETQGYYIVPEEEAYLDYEFIGTSLQGVPYTKKNRVEVAPSTLYDFSFSYQETEYSGGGAELVVTVNSTPLSEETDTVTLQQRPTFHGIFEEGMPYYLGLNEGEEIEVWIAAVTSLSSVMIECDRFSEWSLPIALDLLKLKQSERTDLEEKGLSYYLKSDFVTGTSNMRITFSESLVYHMTAEEGQILISFSATDANGRNRTEELILEVKDMNVATIETDPVEVWATSATLRGIVIYEPQERVYFRYQKAGDVTNWSEIDATVSGTDVYAVVTGLEKNTTYEYQLMEGEKPSTLYTFVTEGEELPNAGFESWQKPGNPWLIYGEGESMFWDSGNHGSASVGSLGGNIAIPGEDYVHSGQYSAKLVSGAFGIQGIFMKFAAGNLFSGAYFATEGTSGGIIGFGRPFTSRPVKLQGYVKYIPQTVDYTEVSMIAKGDLDQGNIFIALGDWEDESTTYSGTTYTWPVIIRTTQNKLFDPTGPDVIAYGEKSFESATEGEGLIPFEIELDYDSYNANRKPTSIIVVATSSKYGDYFSGATGSTMWLDDLELVYE